MSNEVIDWAIKQEIVSNGARKLILLLLANRADDAWECWPSVRLLAKESGLSDDQVRRHLRALEEDGFVKRIPWVREDDGQGSNGYVLGNDPQVTPYALARRGGGHIRRGGYAPTPTGPTHVRRAKNPQSKPAGKPSNLAAREESRRRSSAKAADEREAPTKSALCAIIRESSRQRPEAWAQQIEAIQSRAPRLWRQAEEKAIAQLKESAPEDVKNPAEVRGLAYQYVIHLRAPDWPAWLLGPLLPHLETTRAASGTSA